ncbi:hypothetical protein VA596_37190 [Amycolatopsis sp., V23-08]|uniref:Uncharacterized protein n=1 Tax=Amycolatopsis heterodermiae TaxID=3110235 RepID=A0ABU5RG13_9PSEU|nr:hypothetical protein [Amycolatopsis sp., V23-08]MEA5365216.1 hypothetical protein [Amycolatopsis sp., V23-08]
MPAETGTAPVSSGTTRSRSTTRPARVSSTATRPRSVRSGSTAAHVVVVSIVSGAAGGITGRNGGTRRHAVPVARGGGSTSTVDADRRVRRRNGQLGIFILPSRRRRRSSPGLR